MLIPWFWSLPLQCNKKNSDDGAGSHQEKDEIGGQVKGYIQFTVKTREFKS